MMWSQFEGKTCWVAFSGGLDSSVLLSQCHHLRAQFKMDVRAIHVNHGISSNANFWANHCKNICESYGIPFIERRVSLDLKAGESLEEVARDKRYAIFAEYIEENHVLLTAHHQDDQAETVLLQLLRGAGPKGLSAMPAIKSFVGGYHARPLLQFSREKLEQYAREFQLTWIEDESNGDSSYSRNFIRNEIMPLLTSRWPSASASIARSALHCAENQMLVEGFSRDVDMRGSREDTLSVGKLLQFNPEKQKLFLRTWIDDRQYPLPDSKKMESILKNVLLASWDKLPVVEWGEVVLRRYRDDLYLLNANESVDTDQVIEGLRADIENVRVGFRKGGEVVDLGKRGRHTLKNLFQEWGVLPWERDKIPLVYVGEKLVGVVGYFLDKDYFVHLPPEGEGFL